MSAELLHYSTHPEMQQFLEAAVDTGRDHGAWRVNGDEVLHLHEWRAYPAEIVIVHAGELHRRLMDPELSPKVAHRLWSATHVAR